MLEGLRYALDQTGYLWARDGWSKPPKGDYGVYSVTDQAPMRADNDSAAEIMLQGFVDYFTSAKTLAPKNAIENALRSIGLSWKLESIQFEPSTGYTHYEWSWTDTSGKADMCVIRFVAHDSETVQLVRRGEMPEPPQVAPYFDGEADKLLFVFNAWEEEIVPAVENAEYSAAYAIESYIKPIGSRNRWSWYNIEALPLDYVGWSEGAYARMEEAFTQGVSVILSDGDREYQLKELLDSRGYFDKDGEGQIAYPTR